VQQDQSLVITNGIFYLLVNGYVSSTLFS